MAEVEKVPAQAGEMSARFVQFVMIQSQNVLYSLGLIAPPGAEPPEPNLEVARMLIDQLEMIAEKTRNNLTKEESEVLTNSLQRLRLTFIEVINELRASGEVSLSESAPAASEPAAPTPAPPAAPEPPAPAAPSPDDENAKRFTKKYG
jgi:hypothetical protein